MKYFLLLTSCLFSILSDAQLVAKGLTTAEGKFIGFWQYTPADYNNNPAVKYPLIIFLHGIGERGNGTTELSRVKAQGLPKYIDKGHKMRFFWNGKWETFLVLAPQCSVDTKWYWETYHVPAMIKYARENLRIDNDRIMLMGLSMGGGGAWSYAAGSLNNAKNLAAIGVACGGCVEVKGSAIPTANVPVWASHALDDTTSTALPSCTFAVIDSINKYKPAVKPVLTIYPTGGHLIWDRTFDTAYAYHNPNMYEWFLAQNKSLPPNVLPVARAGNDVSISKTTATVNLSGVSSSDQDGSILKYYWRKVAGPNAGTIANSATPTATVTGLSTEGVYRYELKVIDNRASWAMDTINVTVTGSANKNPVAIAGEDRSIILPVNSVTVRGFSSNDPDGWIAAFAWSYVSGPTSYLIANPTLGQTSINNLVSGTYVFRLTVTDGKGAQGTDDITVTVSGNSTPPPPPSGNQAPATTAGPDKTIVLPVNSVEVNGSTSKDPDGWIAAFEWSYVSGPLSYTIATPTAGKTRLNGLAQGTYQFRLTATDNKGAKASDDVSVRVNASQTAAAGFAQTMESDDETFSELSIFPSHISSTDRLHLRWVSPVIGKCTASVYAVSGRLIKKIVFEKRQADIQTHINVSGLAQGLYFLEVNAGNNGRMVGKFTK